jgi:glycosyltransferase involved in cell wall biosynthesis
MTAKNKKKVLMLVENNSLPFDKRVWRESLTLKNHGYEVKAICPKGKEHKTDYEVIEDVEIYRYNPKFSDGTAKGFIIEYLHSIIVMFFKSLYIFFFKGGFNIIHTANPPDTLCLIAFFYKIFGVKFIYDDHDLVPESYIDKFPGQSKKNNFILKILYFLQKLSYKYSNIVISTNESYKKIASERGGKAPDKVFVVRNGPDTRVFDYTEPDQSLKNGFEHMAAYIGIMGSLDGVDYIIKACHYLVYEMNITNIYYVLIGSGDEFDKLQAMADQLKVTDYIRFTGRIPDYDAIKILSTSDVCLSPDPYNHLNNISTMNKIMEYMVCKSPIVSFDLQEARFSAQKAALYVENNSVIEFAKGIIYLLENRAVAADMVKFGYNRVKNELSWESNEKLLLNSYDSL